jgi:hypothetical protein
MVRVFGKVIALFLTIRDKGKNYNHVDEKVRNVRLLSVPCARDNSVTKRRQPLPRAVSK